MNKKVYAVALERSKGCCMNCKRSDRGLEAHHIIFGQDRKLCENIYSVTMLCPACHRGKEGAHRNRELDLKLKRKLQEKYQDLFNMDQYYSIQEVSEITHQKEKDIQKIFKLTYTKIVDGEVKTYGLSVIRALMGGRLYD